jgi:hypothetical protein
MMAKYRPFKTRFWQDPRVQELSPKAKLTFIYLFTNPSATEAGVFQTTFKTISNETDIDRNEVEEILLEELCSAGLIQYDASNSVVWVVNFLKNRSGGNPKMLVTSINNTKKEITTSLWGQFDKHYETLLNGFLEGSVTDSGKGIGKGIGKGNKKNSASGDADRVVKNSYKTKKGRILKNPMLLAFDKFWTSFAYRKGKAEAADTFLDISPDKALLEKIIEGAKREAQNRQTILEKGGSPKWPQGWLSARRWEDEDGGVCQSPHTCKQCDYFIRKSCDGQKNQGNSCNAFVKTMSATA